MNMYPRFGLQKKHLFIRILYTPSKLFIPVDFRFVNVVSGLYNHMCPLVPETQIMDFKEFYV